MSILFHSFIHFLTSRYDGGEVTYFHSFYFSSCVTIYIYCSGLLHSLPLFFVFIEYSLVFSFSLCSVISFSFVIKDKEFT